MLRLSAGAHSGVAMAGRERYEAAPSLPRVLLPRVVLSGPTFPPRHSLLYRIPLQNIGCTRVLCDYSG